MHIIVPTSSKNKFRILISKLNYKLMTILAGKYAYPFVAKTNCINKINHGYFIIFVENYYLLSSYVRYLVFVLNLTTFLQY